METYIGAIVDFCTGKVFLNSSSPKKLLWIVVPTVASVFLLGIFSARKSKRITAPPTLLPVELKAAKRERVTIDNFLSNDIVPQEIINNILSLMSSEDLAKFGQVSRKFSMLVNDGDLWLHLLQQRWPDEDYSIHPSNFLQSLYSKKAKLEKARLGFTPGRVLLSVMRQCANFSGEEKEDENEDNNEVKEEGWWQKRLINEISAAECGVSIIEGRDEERERGKGKEREEETEETQLFWFETEDREKLGWMRFLDVSDARKKFAGNKMLQEKIDSPFTGEIVGYINMDFNKTPENALTIREFLQTLLLETRGIVGRVDNGYYTHSVVLKTFPLAELLSSEGMNEGDALLDSDINSEYVTSIMQSARILLNENNINNVTVNYVSTTNNPLRCSDITPKMHELSLPVWVLDIDMLSNKTMWNNVYY